MFRRVTLGSLGMTNRVVHYGFGPLVSVGFELYGNRLGRIYNWFYNGRGGLSRRRRDAIKGTASACVITSAIDFDSIVFFIAHSDRLKRFRFTLKNSLCIF